MLAPQAESSVYARRRDLSNLSNVRCSPPIRFGPMDHGWRLLLRGEAKFSSGRRCNIGQCAIGLRVLPSVEVITLARSHSSTCECRRAIRIGEVLFDQVCKWCQSATAYLGRRAKFRAVSRWIAKTFSRYIRSTRKELLWSSVQGRGS